MPANSQNPRRSPWPAFLVSSLLAVCGCATTNLALKQVELAQGYVYDAPAGRLAFPVPPQTLESALLETLNERGYKEIQLEDATDGSTHIQAQGPDNRSLSLAISPNGSGSQAALQVGRFGDKLLTRDLLERTAVRVGLLSRPVGSAASNSGQQAGSAFAPSGVPDAVMLREQAGGGGLQDGFLP